MNKLIYMIFILLVYQSHAQYMIKGKVLDVRSMEPVSRAQLSTGNSTIEVFTDKNGHFIFNHDQKQFLLRISHPDFENQIYPITIDAEASIDLGILFLYTSNLMDSADYMTPLNKETTNPFSYFLARHLKNLPYQEKGIIATQVTLNGIPLTDYANNTFNWLDWQSLYLLGANKTRSSKYNSPFYGNNANLKLKPSFTKEGIQLSGSLSNGSYNAASSVAYSSGLGRNGHSFNLMASKKWAEEGYYSGTLYDAIGLGFVIEFKLNRKNNLSLSGLYSPLRQGSFAHITQRSFNVLGGTYNPQWGFQNGEKRNANLSKRHMPSFLFSYHYTRKSWKWDNSLMIQFGKQSNNFLDFKNADNPFPNYWANLSEIRENPQIDWESLYLANQNSNDKTALYALLEDISIKRELRFYTALSINFSKKFRWTIEGGYWLNSASNYAIPKDLLGANSYHDVNIFNFINGAPAAHDKGQIFKKLGEKSNYHYRTHLNKFDLHTNLSWTKDKYDIRLYGNINHITYQRNGQFLNQIYPANSFGKSKLISFLGTSLSSSMAFKFNPHHQLKITSGFQSNPPEFAHSFINISESNELVPNLKNQQLWSSSLSYQMNQQKLKSYLRVYLSSIKNRTSGRSFFAQTGIGSSFFNESVTKIHQQNIGVDFGLSYLFIPNLTAIVVAGIGQNSYAKNANVALNFNPNSLDQNNLSVSSLNNYGTAFVKNYRVSNGPQQIFGLAFEYKNKNKLRATISGVHLSNNYIDIATHKRSSNFFINPQTPGLPFENIDPEQAKMVLKQERLPVINSVNLGLSKTWQLKNNRISLSVQIHNVFKTLHVLNGYEQSRLSTYELLQQDVSLGDVRNFGHKYRFGQGRTFRINLILKR